jgi:acetolactate synthase I/II/III large subunit
MSSKTVAEILVESLRDLGVKHVFGVPSGGWIDYMEAIRRTDGMEFILTTHEGGAGFMADVCGRLTGVPGVCFGTFGPGATNLATGVGSAQLDRSPVIALTDEMPGPMRQRITQMGIDHQALFAPITKWTTRLSASNAGEIINRAADIATAETPGAVHIGMPVDVGSQTPKSEKRERANAINMDPTPTENISRARDMIRDARKPLLVLGLGAVRANLRNQLIAFAENQGMPVILTPMAKGMIPEYHDLYAGILFHALSDQVAETHRQADLVVAVGYDPIEFNFEAWMPPVPLINIDSVGLDIDLEEYSSCLDITGDIALNFSRISSCPAGDTDWDLAALALRKNRMFAQLSPDSPRMGPCGVLDTLRKILPDDGIMTCDVGAHTHLIGQKWRTPYPGTQIMTNGWSSMGFGLPAAIAAKFCKSEKKVCAVVGDGGFLMTAGELATAVRYNLNIVVLVLTDNDLALIRIKQERKNNPVYGTPVREQTGTIGGPDIFGAPVKTARTIAELANALDWAFATEGPAIVEALVDSREYDDLVLKRDKVS